MDRQRPDNIFGKVLGFFEGITDYVSDYQDQRCEDALKLRQEVSDLLEFLKDREQVRELYASIEKAEDEVFVGEAQSILNDPVKSVAFWETIEKLEEIYEFLKQCNSEDWASYQDQGIVPWCIWKEAEIPRQLYYRKVDLPFVSGVIDGIYQEGEGLVELPKMIYQLGNGINDFIYAYTLAYYQCSPTKVAMNEKRMGLLLEKLEATQEAEGVWSWLKTQWYSIDNYVATYKDEKCEDAAKLRGEIDELIDYISELENIKKLIEEIEENLAAYWGEIEQKTNIGRYEEGKIVVVVGSLFISAGALAATKIGRIKQILQKLHSFTKGQWDEFFREANRHFNIALTGSYWNNFSKIKMKIASIDKDGWLMGKYVNGKLQVIGNTNVAQKWDYIVKTDGQILVGRKHSWLSQGEDVLAAGELKFNNGKLVEISNASGHYEPTISEASNFLRIFRQANVEVDNATLTILDKNGNIFKQVTPTAGDRLTYY